MFQSECITKEMSICILK